MHLKGAKLEEAVFRLEAIETKRGFFPGQGWASEPPFSARYFWGMNVFWGVFFFGSFKLDSKVPEFPNKRRTGD